MKATEFGGMTFDVTEDPATQVAMICDALKRKIAESRLKAVAPP
jgi:hypothetical protein